jgi:hypothetical protein
MHSHAFPASSKARTATEYALGHLPNLSSSSASSSSRRAFLAAARPNSPSASRSGTGIVLAMLNETSVTGHGQATGHQLTGRCHGGGEDIILKRQGSRYQSGEGRKTGRNGPRLSRLVPPSRRCRRTACPAQCTRTFAGLDGQVLAAEEQDGNTRLLTPFVSQASTLCAVPGNVVTEPDEEKQLPPRKEDEFDLLPAAAWMADTFGAAVAAIVARMPPASPMTQ